MRLKRQVLRFSGLRLLRSFYHIYRESRRPAPLNEFADYDKYWALRAEKEDLLGIFLPRYKICADLIPDDSRVLDVGCGPGGFIAYLKEHKAKCYGYGVDVSPLAINMLQEHGLQGTVLDLSRSLRSQINGSFDTIVLMEVIEHIVDAESLLKQAMEFNPDRIIVTIPNMVYIANRVRLLLGRMPITVIVHHMREHVRFWTVRDFRQWSDFLGLKVNTILPQYGGWKARLLPGMFARQVVYELALKSPRLMQTPEPQ